MQSIRNTSSNRVLLIDDSDIARAAVGHILEEGGYTYYDVSSPLGATSLIARLDIDILVVDMNMPVMSGSRFAQLVRNNPRFSDVKLILITGDSEAQLESAGKKTDADAVLMKVDLVDDLLPTLKRISAPSKSASSEKTAMIIDFHPEEREACKRELEALGYEVSIRAHGRGALADVVMQKPSLVVVAADLPDLPGTAIVELIRENRSTETMPVILRAEGSSLEIANAARTCGATSAISTGLGGAELSQRLHDVLSAA